jgi:hypothetical protein
MRKAAIVVGSMVLGALLCSACGFGITGGATNISDVSAVLSGTAGTDTQDSALHWWFEYGPTDHYGKTTAVGTANTNQSFPVAVRSAAIGLSDGTTYHYRLCAKGTDGRGVCGADRTFTTTTGHDSVIGSGTVLDLGFGAVWGGAADVIGAAATPGPATGDAELVPGSVYFKVADSGPATCLTATGNRVAIGFTSNVDIGQPDPQPVHRILFVEDNGPTGDRIGFGTLAPPYTRCPAPTDASFPDFDVAGYSVPPVLETGDFTVHDHPGH